jgi:hypothetical protein
MSLSYVNLTNAKAKVICTCGWETPEFLKGPYDPTEALVAYSVEHLKCNEPPPEVYYAVAQEIHGKLRILCDLDSSPGAKERMVELAKGSAQKGMSKKVLEIKISSSWVG